MLKLPFIDGSAMVATKPNKFSPNLVGETGHSDGSQNPNRAELRCTNHKKP